MVVNSVNKKAPKINQFSGTLPVAKGEVSYGQWVYEVEMLRESYTEELIKEGIAKSLKGSAADLVRFLGPAATLDQILAKLQAIHKPHKSHDKLMAEFYTIDQEEETIQEFAIKLEGALNEIKVQYPEKFTNGETETSLRDRLFHGMRKSIRDTIRFQFSNPDIGYAELLVAARKAEAEEEPNGGARGGKKKATTTMAKSASTSGSTTGITAETLQEAISKAMSTYEDKKSREQQKERRKVPIHVTEKGEN